MNTMIGLRGNNCRSLGPWPIESSTVNWPTTGSTSYDNWPSLFVAHSDSPFKALSMGVAYLALFIYKQILLQYRPLQRRPFQEFSIPPKSFRRR